MQEWKKDFLWGTGIVLTLVLICFDLLTKDPLLGGDDSLLIQPLRTVSSLPQYTEGIRTGKIYDVQPLRDASFLVNIYLERLTGHGFYHLFNLLLWLGIVGLLWAILQHLSPKPLPYSRWLLTLFALHPSLLTCVFWVSARKHLLATFFLLWATFLTLTNRKKRWILSLYLASLLSHPIGILWPFWYFYQTRDKKYSAVLALLMGGFSWLNYHYYTVFYPRTGAMLDKFQADLGKSLDSSLMGLARSFFQLFFPVSLSPSYYIGHWGSLAGIPLVVCTLFLCLKCLEPRQRGWTLLLFLPFVTVYARMTNIFVSDTYLILPGAALTVALILSARTFARPKLLRTGCAVVTALFIFQAGRWSQAWKSDEALWTHAFKTEPSPDSLPNYIKILVRQGRHLEARRQLLRLKEWTPEHPWVKRIFSESGTQ